MAIRLEAFFPVVQLSDIYVADSPSASKLSLEVHAPTVRLSEVTIVERARIPLIASSMLFAGVSFERMVMAEAAFQKMVAAGIWMDADTNNRFLADTTMFTDGMFLLSQGYVNDAFYFADDYIGAARTA